MGKIWKKITIPLILVLGICFVEAGITIQDVDARSFKGGRSFKMPSKKAPSQYMKSSPGVKNNSGSISRGLAGGLLGGALGGLLLGSLFGMGGQGMGILPLLLLAGVGFMLYRKFSQPSGNRYQEWNRNEGQTGPPPGGSFDGGFPGSSTPSSRTPDIGSGLKEKGLSQIKQYESGFDDAYFLEVASDVFFKVQAGWMRRDINSYRHLLGDVLAGEYEQHFEDMRAKGHINKLESIAIRGIEICEAGSDGSEDFVTVRFSANLLDYTVDDKSGDLVDGSMTTPVKFQEDWTWARATGTQDWKLEGIK